VIAGIKSVIFNMDGVLVDPEPLYPKVSENLFRKEFSISVSEVYNETVGRKEDEAIEIVARDFGLDTDLKDLVARIRRDYCDQLWTKASPTPGSLQLISNLNRRYRLALASSSRREYLDVILTKFKIENAFEVVVTGDDSEKGNPNPEMYVLTAQNLRLKPYECLVLEDSENGVNAAKNAGMKCIAIVTGFTEKQDFSRADHLVRSLWEIGPCLGLT